jgi:outer membrane protein assembly factor BamB
MWPVLHADGRNSDWVALAGPRDLVPTWHALDGKPTAAVVAIGPERQLYTVTMDEGPCHLYAFDKDGTRLWCSDQVRTAFTAPAVGKDGAVFVDDGTEVFRFEADGSLSWRVGATAPALGVVFTREGFLLVMDAIGLTSVYDPGTGNLVAQLPLPVGFQPRPQPLPIQLQAFKLGAPKIGMDPAFVDFFIDAFFDYNVAVGNNVPAIHPETGRIFIAVSASPTGTEGLFYGIDFIPPSDEAPGSLEIACSAPIGLASGTSPAISLDGVHVYAGDSGGFLTAFHTADCTVAWTLSLSAASLASPTVGLDGRVYMLVGGQVVALQDHGSAGEVLWQTDIAPIAQGQGYATGGFNAVLPLAQNYLYGAATLAELIGGRQVPRAHVVATLNLADGAIVSVAELGEESASTLSLGRDGALYVPSKPIAKATLLGTPLAPSVPAPHAGIYAFEPASFRQLTADGLMVALDFAQRAESALGTNDTVHANADLARAICQLTVTGENLGTAQQRGEVEAMDAHRVFAQIDMATRELRLAVKAIRKGQRWVPKGLIRSSQHALERGFEVLSIS